MTSFSIKCVFRFCKKKKEVSRIAIFDHFWSFFGYYIGIFHKTEIQTVILRCSVCINLIWIKSYNIILVKIFLFYASFLGYFAEVSFDTSEGNQLSCFQNIYFSKILFDFHKSHNQVKYR